MKRIKIHSRVVRLPTEVIKRHAVKEALVLKPRDERQVVRGKPEGWAACVIEGYRYEGKLRWKEGQIPD
jgi:hypothetical protein